MVMMRDLELLVLGFVFLILVRIGELVEVTANHRLRFILPSPPPLKSAVAFSHPGKPPNKAHKLLPCPMTDWSQPLLSFWAEMWQSVHVLVSCFCARCAGSAD